MEILEEFKKMPANRDMVLVHQHMQRTFPLRREEIVTLAPPIAELKDRWPALFSEAQLYGEFHRIINQSLQYSFFAALDKNTAKLLKLYKERKTGAFGEKMADLLMAYEEQDKNDISATRTAALAGLPLYLKEDSSVARRRNSKHSRRVKWSCWPWWLKRTRLQGFPFNLSMSQSSWRVRWL
ncbi:uncharacterized protein LOC130190815 isoform X2 [Pseudoliparis swirei]|nr:uncharacterized protein LOC130190815 isoform X2 [Pseudoliparis swirei]